MLSEAIMFATRFALLLPAIILHEVAHGYVAYRLGDPTAKDAGRLTLNPIKHIDLWGTILMPALLLLVSGGSVAFGYAKPVPVNPMRFKDHRAGMFWVGIAGPATNVVLAAISGLLVRLVGLDSIFGLVLWSFAYLNLILVFFNLIPIPPLDGSRVLPLFLPDSAMDVYYKMEQYGFVILLAILWFAPRVLGFDPISSYLNATVGPLLQLFTGVGL